MSEQELLRAKVFAIVRLIPRGRVSSYGAVGAKCDPPISGYICGRILGFVEEGVPWWRVVGKTGDLPIRKRNPALEERQKTLLGEEGVKFDDRRVLAEFFAD